MAIMSTPAGVDVRVFDGWAVVLDGRRGARRTVPARRQVRCASPSGSVRTGSKSSADSAAAPAGLAKPVGIVGDGVDACGEVGVAGEVRVGVGERLDEVGGVVVRECLGKVRPGRVRRRGEVGECGDLAGELSQVSGVVPGPGGDAAVGGAVIAGGLYALFARAAGSSRAYAEIAPLSGLPAGDAQGVGQVGPAGARVTGRFDESGLPSGELLAEFAQHEQGSQGLLRTGLSAFWACRRPGVLGAADGFVDRVQRFRGCEEGRGLLEDWDAFTGPLLSCRPLGDTELVIVWMTCYNSGTRSALAVSARPVEVFSRC